VVEEGLVCQLSYPELFGGNHIDEAREECTSSGERDVATGDLLESTERGREAELPI